MLVCSRCRQDVESLIITEESSYCYSCYKLEECDMLYGRGQESPEEKEKFFSVLAITKNINGAHYVLDENGKLDGYVCSCCGGHAYGKSCLTGVCVDCAEKLIYEEEEEEPERVFEPISEEGMFRF